MTEAYIGLGSNIEPQKYTVLALEYLQRELDVVAISKFYRSPAIGTAIGQADFINGVVKVKSTLTAKQLKFDVLREIEYKLGRRQEMPKHAARTMDLDLLVFGDQIIRSMNIPEADILKRPFVYIPLLDVEPQVSIVGMDKPLSQLVVHKHSMSLWQVEDLILN
ncbi:MAG: 2-amino-4-hydroxy-6-hydroxymethyldihydropteridine diphosphokinase [Lentisphaeraceae bacterium]|nr:2-amino-4-hydroxy-6-hydroxymethyldihydropteridine diphosphokinase [Lentisphaeraceae bacterium]